MIHMGNWHGHSHEATKARSHEEAEIMGIRRRAFDIGRRNMNVDFAMRGSTIAKESEPTHSCVAPIARGMKAAARIAFVIFITSNAFAQTGGGYDLTWSTIDSGGAMSSTGNGYELGGTIGQADAGTLSGGAYALDGGFWAAGVPCECQLFGDLVDVNSLPMPDCNIDVTDLLCVLDDFTDPAACPGDGDILTSGGACAADGTIDVDDLLAVLDAFAGIFACPHPCPP